MKIKRLLKTELFVLFYFVFFSKIILSQVNFQVVANHQYAQFDGVWYTTVDGKKGDLVDMKHLVVRLKTRNSIDTFNFFQLGLPQLMDVRGRFSNGYYELEVPNVIDPFQVALKLNQTEMFDEVMFNIIMEVDAIPNDPNYSSMWNLPKVQMSNAWDISTGTPNIVVAVIDVGSDYNHEDLLANRWPGVGYDFYNHDSDPYPSDSARHGTVVAGIIGAVTNNSLGVSGVAGGWGGIERSIFLSTRNYQ
jgi:subtilisin family serine protease